MIVPGEGAGGIGTKLLDAVRQPVLGQKTERTVGHRRLCGRALS